MSSNEEFEHSALSPERLLIPRLSFNTENTPLDQDRIRQRAYSIWEKSGKPDGAHDEHWQQACSEIEAEHGAPSVAPPSTEEMTAEMVHMAIE